MSSLSKTQKKCKTCWNYIPRNIWDKALKKPIRNKKEICEDCLK